jgi:anti-anti-sigma regulatory factor
MSRNDRCGIHQDSHGPEVNAQNFDSSATCGMQHRGSSAQGVLLRDQEGGGVFDKMVCLRRSAEFRLSEGVGGADCTLHCEQSEAWKRDVALAISVNDKGAIVIIHMEGTLDHETALNVTALVAELIADGRSDFELQTSELCVPDKGGVDVLLGLQQLVHGAGGRLAWTGSVANRSFPVVAFAPQSGARHTQGAAD